MMNPPEPYDFDGFAKYGDCGWDGNATWSGSTTYGSVFYGSFECPDCGYESWREFNLGERNEVD